MLGACSLSRVECLGLLDSCSSGCSWIPNITTLLISFAQATLVRPHMAMEYVCPARITKSRALFEDAQKFGLRMLTDTKQCYSKTCPLLLTGNLRLQLLYLLSYHVLFGHLSSHLQVSIQLITLILLNQLLCLVCSFLRHVHCRQFRMTSRHDTYTMSWTTLSVFSVYVRSFCICM